MKTSPKMETLTSKQKFCQLSKPKKEFDVMSKPAPAGIGSNRLNRMLNPKPACLTQTPIYSIWNSHVRSLSDRPWIEHIDEFIERTILMEIALHVHKKPKHAECSHVNIFLHFQHSREKVNMRLNRNVQSQYRFNIGSFSDMRFS